MRIEIPKTRAEIRYHLHDHLIRNSFFIMLTSISSAGFGFVFWMLAAKLYSPEEVGIATALVSSMLLLVLLSRLGLDFSIIRFFPTHDKSRIFSTSVIVTTFSAVIFGAIFIFGVDTFLPELCLLKSSRNTALFLIFLVASSVTALTGISFIAIRRGEFRFLQSVAIGTRIVFLIPLITLGAIGIFIAVGMSFVFTFVVALFLLKRSGIRPEIMVDRSFLKESLHFSAGNYLAGLFMTAPNMILPIIVLNMLGAEKAAYYYIAYAIAALLFMIPNAISLSLFAEGSHGEALKRTVVKSLLVILSLLIPATALLYVCGGWVLGLVGTDYAAGGLDVLRVMVFASLFVGVNYVYFAIKRIQKDVMGMVVVSGLIFGMLVGLSYAFMFMFGVIGVGYAWVVANGVGTIYVGLVAWKEGWSKSYSLVQKKQ